MVKNADFGKIEKVISGIFPEKILLKILKGELR